MNTKIKPSTIMNTNFDVFIFSSMFFRFCLKVKEIGA